MSAEILMTSKEILYVFDISNMIHRAFHAMEKNNLSTASGFPTGAIYGTFNMLTNFITKFRPQNMLICYDPQDGNSVRKDMYPLYKSNRVQVNAVSAQELIIRRMIELLGIASVEASGYEADDMIGTAVVQFRDEYNIEIITGDKDMLQLVGPGVNVYDSMKGVYYGDAEVSKKFGVRPNQIVDYLAIVGDTADCIPGVKGIGHKGAGKLLAEFSSVEEIYENLDKITGSTYKKLVAGKIMAELSWSLANLQIVDVDWDNKDVSFSPQVNRDLIELLSKLDFDKSLIKLNAVWNIYGKETIKVGHNI